MEQNQRSNNINEFFIDDIRTICSSILIKNHSTKLRQLQSLHNEILNTTETESTKQKAGELVYALIQISILRNTDFQPIFETTHFLAP